MSHMYIIYIDGNIKLIINSINLDNKQKKKTIELFVVNCGNIFNNSGKAHVQ